MGKAFRLVTGIVLASLILVVLTTPILAQPDIELSESKGHVAKYVTVSGEGFPSDTWVILTYDDNVLKTLKTLNGGTLEDTMIQIPDSTAGAHEVRVLKASDGTLLASELFTIEPELTLKPNTGLSGDIVIASGTGYASGSEISFTWSSSVSAQVSPAGSGGGSSNCGGRFSIAVTVSASVSVEMPIPVTVRVTATDGRGHSNRKPADFVVLPFPSPRPPIIPPPIPPPQPPPEPPPTPPDGVQPQLWLTLAIIIVGVGLVVLVIALVVRTRRQT